MGSFHQGCGGPEFDLWERTNVDEQRRGTKPLRGQREVQGERVSEKLRLQGAERAACSSGNESPELVAEADVVLRGCIELEDPRAS